MRNGAGSSAARAPGGDRPRRNRGWVGRRPRSSSTRCEPPRSTTTAMRRRRRRPAAAGRLRRNRENKLVHFDGAPDLVGRMVNVRVEHAGPYALRRARWAPDARLPPLRRHRRTHRVRQDRAVTRARASVPAPRSSAPTRARSIGAWTSARPRSLPPTAPVCRTTASTWSTPTSPSASPTSGATRSTRSRHRARGSGAARRRHRAVPARRRARFAARRDRARPVIRAAVEARLADEGLAAARRAAARRAPSLAASIDLANPRRVVRALERASRATCPAPEPRGYPAPVVWLGTARRAGSAPGRARGTRPRAVRAGLLDEAAAFWTAIRRTCAPLRPWAIGRPSTSSPAARRWTRRSRPTRSGRRAYARRQRTWFRAEPGIDVAAARAGPPGIGAADHRGAFLCPGPLSSFPAGHASVESTTSAILAPRRTAGRARSAADGARGTRARHAYRACLAGSGTPRPAWRDGIAVHPLGASVGEEGVTALTARGPRRALERADPSRAPSRPRARTWHGPEHEGRHRHQCG